MRLWEARVLAYHTAGTSSGPTEAVNLRIENIRGTGYGMRNFNNYRPWLLLR